MTYQQLTQEERIIIYVYRKAGFSVEFIAEEINRHKSTIYREFKRNKGKKGYRHKQAHEKALIRRMTSKKAVRFTKRIRRLVREKLKLQWSPVQISEWLKISKDISISHQRIYEFVEKDKMEGGSLYTNLRQWRRKRRKKYGSNASKRGIIKGRVSISERPAHIERRSTCGHWEGDTIIGKNHKSVMITLVERKFGWTEIIKVDSKNSDLVAREIVRAMKKYLPLVKSITFDNGLEFADHKIIARELKCRIYFADAYSSWQRGTNENTNGLIRQYLPKGSDFREFSRKYVRFVKSRLNNRPRLRLGFKTPEEMFRKELVALNI